MATYETPDNPKALRETLLVAIHTMQNFSMANRKGDHIDRLRRLVAECDRKRPLGMDGRHGNRHTNECGCDISESDRTASILRLKLN